MTKKIFAMFLAVLMVASVLPTSVFAANKHPDPGQHTAENCNCVVVRVTEPTCGAAGYTTYQCECGEIFADNYKPATGVHAWVEGEGKAPTCGTAGYEAGLECEDCGEVKPGATIAPLFKAGTACEWVNVTSNVSCLTGGTIQQKCAACGATKTVKVDKSETGEHDWDYENMSVKAEPTATEAGIVVVTCKDCYTVEEIEWYPVHLCSEALMLHKRVEATCTSNGNIEHYECRVCGKLYGNADATDRLRDNEYADSEAAKVGYAGHGIILLGGHTKPASFVASCEDQTVTCAVASCKAKFVVKGAHDVDYTAPTSHIDPTCTTKGYTTYVCRRAECKMPVVIEYAAKGHVEITVTVPSTCHTYGYTYTACMRENCNKVISNTGKIWYDTDNGGVAYGIGLEYTVADRLVANDVAYNLSFTVKKAHFYAGAFSAGMFAGAEEANATNFYLEAYKNYKNETVAGAYRLYTKDGSNKTYYVVGSDLKLTTATPVAGDEQFWAMNEELGVLTFKVAVGGTVYEMFLAGAEAAADVYVITALPTQYMPYVTAGYYYLVQLSFPVLNTRLVDIEVDFEGKFNENNHDWAEIKNPATCTTEGSLTTYCKNGCAVGKTETLAKGEHQWAKTTDVATIVAGGFLVSAANVEKANDCDTAGFHYELCTTCGTVRHVVDAAEGHYWDTIEARYQYATHTQNAYWYYACEYCDEQYIISAVTPWALENYLFETWDAAYAAHNNKLSATGTVVSAGSCSVAGKQLFLCTECNKYVAVKTTLEAKDSQGNVLGEYISGNHFIKAGQTAQAGGPLAEGTVLTAANYYKAPTCLEEGYIYSFVCGVCGETIGEAAAGKAVVLKKAAHNFAPAVDSYGVVTNEISALEAYLNPCPNAIPYKCTTPGCNAFCTSLDSNPKADCEDPAFDLYICSCGEKHLRGMFGAFGHEWVNPVNSTPTSHRDPVITTYTCAYCTETKQVKNPVVHVNADGEKFTDLCNDPETDRHCIKCCQEVTQCYTKGSAHVCTEKQPGTNKPCNCVIKRNHRWDLNTVKNSSCTMPAYTVKICKDCDEQQVIPAAEYSFKYSELTQGTDYYTIKDAVLAELLQKTATSTKVIAGTANAADADGKIITSIANSDRPVNFVGHKPAEVDYELNADGTKKLKDGKPIEIRYANYTYIENYVYTWYEYAEVLIPEIDVETVNAQMGEFKYNYLAGEDQVVRVLIEKSVTYTAKFDKYVAPTFAADGVLETECQLCHGKVSQVLPKQTGLGFEMSIANANGQSGLAFGSLIEVTVSVNALKADIYGFQFNVTNSMGKDMIYVGYETVNENFNITVTNPEEVAQKGKALIVSGFANNNAEGKVQNIEITEKTALVKLYFRSVSENTGKYNFNFANANATSLKNGETKATATAANYKKAEAKISGLMDFNGDKIATSTDLYQAMTLITGEHASGKSYDVTVDLNKDGELTLEDLAIGYNYLVGNYELVDMLMLGLSADEAELMAKLMKEKPAYTCDNEACEYGSKYKFDVCPVCRTIQIEEPVAPTVYKCNNPTACDFESLEAFKFCPKCRHEQNPMAHCTNGHEFNPAFAYCPECGELKVI